MGTESRRVAGVVLAAGEGRRYGKPKALVELHGRLLVERAAEVLRDGGCDPVVVVLGAAADDVLARARLDGILVVRNENWPSGMASSLHAALTALSTPDDSDDSADSEPSAVDPLDAVVAAAVLPVDVPGVTAAAVRRVLAAAGEPVAERLVAATYDGVRGHPVLLGRAHWAGVLATATGDAGARDYLRTHDVLAVPCEDVAVGTDVDRPADLPD